MGGITSKLSCTTQNDQRSDSQSEEVCASSTGVETPIMQTSRQRAGTWAGDGLDERITGNTTSWTDNGTEQELLHLRTEYKGLQKKYAKLKEDCQQIEERNAKLSRTVMQLRPTEYDETNIDETSEKNRQDCGEAFENLLGVVPAHQIMKHLNENLANEQSYYAEIDTRELLESIFEKSYWSWKEVITRQSDFFDSLFNVHERVRKSKMVAIRLHYQEVVAEINVDKKVEEVTKKVCEEVPKLKEHLDKEKEWFSKKADAHPHLNEFMCTDTENCSSNLLASNDELDVDSVSTLEDFVKTSVKIAWRMISLVPPMVIDRPNILNAKELQQVPLKKVCPIDGNFSDITDPDVDGDSATDKIAIAKSKSVKAEREVHSLHPTCWNPDLSPAEYELVYFRPVLYDDHNGQNKLNGVVANKQRRVEK